MTDSFAEVSATDAVFGGLRNLMDMCVVAAIIEKEGLSRRANCSLPLLTGADSELEIDNWHAPKTVSTQCSTMKTGREYTIAASGGVQIRSWDVADNSVVMPGPARVRREAAFHGSNWWWNQETRVSQ
jgi:hypothetical protein